MSEALMLQAFGVCHLSVRTCEQSRHSSMHLDAVWGGVPDFCGDRRREGAVWGWIKCKSGVQIDYRLMCEKSTVFPYAECSMEFYERAAFVWYSQVQDWSGGWREIRVQKAHFKCNRLAQQQELQHLRHDSSRCTPDNVHADLATSSSWFSSRFSIISKTKSIFCSV